MTGSESFFDALKSKRKSQNIEISEICEFTKIHPRYIESIETGDFTVLPNIYLRLFIRSYAKFIGADSAKALKDFELYSTGKITRNEEFKNKEVDATPSSPPHPATEMDSTNPQISPKQIASGIGITFVIFILLWWASRVTQEQTEYITSSEPIAEVAAESVHNLDNEAEKPEPNLSEPVSKPTTDQAINADVEKQPAILPDNSPLNNNDFLPGKKVNEISQSVKLFSPYTISITILQDTKLNISKIENAEIIQLINRSVSSGQQFIFDFTSTVNFEFWSSQQVNVKLNETSIDNYLTNGDLAIRGSYESEKSKLYLSFYKR